MIRFLVALLIWAQALNAEINHDAISDRRPPKLLSSFGFFVDLAAMTPASGVVPYEISSPLFSDYAEKSRYIYAPAPAEYQETTSLAFPVGSALIKTFHYGSHKVETRVLLHQESGWRGWAYVWNEAGDDAALKIAGANIEIENEHGLINYRVPNANQCKACHVDPQGEVQPIGPKIRNLNLGHQLNDLVLAGVLTSAPDDAPTIPNYRDAEANITARARAYLDANCGHCHAPGLPADTSGLYLNWEEDRAIHIGINKHPVAAGRGSGGLSVDIDPGNPDGSIFVFRMESTDPGIMMPELGRSLRHEEGIALIRAYISQLNE